MKTLLLFLLLLITCNASFANDNKVCQKCHPLIYKEYYDSIHRKSSLANDAIYRAVLRKNTKKKKEANATAVMHQAQKTCNRKKKNRYHVSTAIQSKIFKNMMKQTKIF
ncbi:hypothetical protein [Sulfurimonas sp. NW9]|uniref:hypothetical protein n=1 Tax=Sulfurimonas sp. NW9 TaxID=2922728 RepID=UPI003DA80D4E